MSVLTVIAHYRATAGKGDAVASLLERHIGPSRAEPGCVQFLVYRSADNPDDFALYEQYIDEAAFQAHRVTKHFRDNIDDGVVPLLAERSWRRYEQIEP